MGEKARLVEILSEEDQEFILPLMKVTLASDTCL